MLDLDRKNKGVEALAQVAQRSCGCSIPGSVQGQVGATWSSGRCPCLWQGGWNRMIFKGPFNPNHSVILYSVGGQDSSGLRAVLPWYPDTWWLHQAWADLFFLRIVVPVATAQAVATS